MNLEEYNERLAQQGRKPVDAETYANCIEPAYMALGDTDKDEFARFSDAAIADIRRLAQERDSAKYAAEKAGEAQRDATRAHDALTATIKRADTARRAYEEELALRDALIDDLLGAMPADEQRRFLLDTRRKAAYRA